MPNNPFVNDPRFVAAIDLVRRTGARQIQIRYSDDESPVVWMAVAGYSVHHGKLSSVGKINAYKLGAALDPREALFRLLNEAIDGAQCAHCGRPSGFVEGTENMPLSEHICWYIFDPETNKYMRGCEASDE